MDDTSPLQSNVAAECKSSSITPDRSFVRMKKAVMQSCWIQRINSTCDTSALEEEELEPNPVWTHFTKDFSSCSKRLHKAHSHTRSSSWPPNERTTNCSPSLDLKLVKPVDIKEPFPLSRAFLPTFREESSRVPPQDGSESNCFKTGNLFSSQNSSHKSVEALVPCSHAARTCDDFHAGKRNDEGMLKSSAAQYLYSKFNVESGSLLEVSSARVLGDAPCKGKLPVSELAHKMPHARGCSPDALMGASADADDRTRMSHPLIRSVHLPTPSTLSINRPAVIGTSLSPALMGASADADDRTRMSHPLIRSVHLPTPSTLSINRPAVVFGDTEKKVNKNQSGMVFNKHPGKVCGKEVKTRRNFGFLHVAGQSKKPSPLGANPFMGRGGSWSRGCSDKVGACDKGAGSFTASKPIQRKHNVGFGTFATNAGSFVSKELYNLDSFNKDLRRCDPVVAKRPWSPKEELGTKMPPTRVPSGDFTRASCRETSFDEYWVQLFEDSRPAKLFDTSYPKDNPPQEHITDGCYRFSFNNATANRWKPDENEKRKSFPHPGAHIPLNSSAQIHTSYDVPPQTQVPSTSSFIHTKQTGLGHNRGTSANRSPLDGTSVFKTWQEESLQGGMRRLAPKTGKKELFCDNGRITEPSRNEAWIQRWQSSSNLVAVSEKTLLTSFGMDKGKGSAPGKRHTSTSPKGVKDMDWINHNLLGPARASKLHTDNSARRYDFVEAMAIVGNTAGKLHTASLENKGSFTVWPCPSEQNYQGKRVAEPRETVEDAMHGAEMDDLEFLERMWR